MVDIIDSCLRVNQLYEEFDNLNNILFGQNPYIHIGVESQLLVDSVATYFTQVVTLVREEQVLDNLTCTCIIGRIGITQLAIYVEHGLLLRVRRVFLKRIEDDGVILCRCLVLVDKNRRRITLKDINQVILSDLCLTFHDNLITLNRYYLTCVLIRELLVPALKHTCSKTLSNILLKVGFVYLNLVGEFKYLKYIPVSLKTNSTQKSCNRQLLLTVDICIHHIVNVGCKFNP